MPVFLLPGAILPEKSLVLKNIAFAYEPESGKRVFNGLDAVIPLRGVTLVLGPNASGKTTLARLLAGFDDVTDGEFLWPEEVPAEPLGWTAPRVGVVFDEPEIQFQTFELRDEISVGLFHCGASPEMRERRIDEVCGLFGFEQEQGSSLDLLEPADKLAVLCAAFVALAPRVLVLDFSPLALGKEFRDILFSLSRSGQGPALVCLSREAEDIALLGPEEKAFLLQGGRMEELPPDPASTALLDRLVVARIRLPWYSPLARELYLKGRLPGLLYPGTGAFREEFIRSGLPPGARVVDQSPDIINID